MLKTLNPNFRLKGALKTKIESEFLELFSQFFKMNICLNIEIFLGLWLVISLAMTDFGLFYTFHAKLNIGQMFGLIKPILGHISKPLKQKRPKYIITEPCPNQKSSKDLNVLSISYVQHNFCKVLLLF